MEPGDFDTDLCPRIKVSCPSIATVSNSFCYLERCLYVLSIFI